MIRSKKTASETLKTSDLTVRWGAALVFEKKVEAWKETDNNENKYEHYKSL